MLTATNKDQNPWAAIAIVSPDITATNLKHLGNDHIVVSEIKTQNYQFYAISGYLPPNQDPTPIIGSLSRALDLLRGSSIIIGLDANARSTLWGSITTNKQGEAVEEFIAQHDLKLINRPTDLTTFCSSRGSSNIDITLCKGQIRRHVCDWRVEDNWTLSDHRMLLFKIKTQIIAPIQELCIQPRYKISLRKYDKFNNKLEQNISALPDSPTTKMQINNYVLSLEEAYINTANSMLKKQQINRITVPWWTKALTRLRIQTHSARKTFQRYSGQNDHATG